MTRPASLETVSTAAGPALSARRSTSALVRYALRSIVFGITRAPTRSAAIGVIQVVGKQESSIDNHDSGVQNIQSHEILC